jgi:hypothetical protein
MSTDGEEVIIELLEQIAASLTNLENCIDFDHHSGKLRIRNSK